MAAKLQPVQTLCHGCLSADRDLSPIGEFSDMFTMICGWKEVHVLGMKDITLCWECTATLRRMQSFQKQVYDALTKLEFCVRTKKKPLPKSLSKLKITKTNHDFISLTEPCEPELDIKPLCKIKEEVCCDENEDVDVNTNDFLYVETSVYIEDLKSEPNLNIKVNDIKTEDKTTKTNKNLKPNFRYIHISTPDKMCVEEQQRPWERDKYIGNGSKLSSERLEELSSHETVYRCLVCGHRSPSMAAAGRHVAQHGEIVKCRLCEYCSVYVRDVKTHYKLAHTEFLCDHCGKKHKSKRGIETHLERNHRASYACAQCPSTFRTHARLAHHARVVHATHKPEETYCVTCNKKFKNRTRYMCHLKGTLAHSKEGYYGSKGRIKCLVCEKSYTKKQAMLEHYAYKHLGKSKYYCQDCQLYFVSASTYSTHRRIRHEGGLPRDKVCGVCGRGFTRKPHLINHMRRHTGERPFACAVCDARFAQQVARDVHQKRHSRETNK